jgi:predicted AAA+ superfamily ATPase
MAWHYLKRSLELVLSRAAAEFPAVVLTGPRQSGKTTLFQHLFGETHGYISLELPDVRASAAADPRGFLQLRPPPVILDEVQYAPELLPYLKEAIDARRQGRGLYLLTGSQKLLLMARNLTAFQKDLPGLARPGYVIHPGQVRLPLRQELSLCLSANSDRGEPVLY